MHRLPLYLGLDPGDLPCIHYPVIQTLARSSEHPEIHYMIENSERFSLLICTSQQTVHFLSELPWKSKYVYQMPVVAIGPSTAEALRRWGCQAIWVAPHATQEGIIEWLENNAWWKGKAVLYPRSSRARPLLADYLRSIGEVSVVDLYDTKLQCLEPIPDLAAFDEIIFTSPSTVEGFLKIYGALPINKQLTAIGPITENALNINLLKSLD